MIKAILFDFDGVLVESVDIKRDAFAEMFAYTGKDTVEKIVKYHIDNGGISRFDKFRYIYEHIMHRQLDDLVMRELSERFSRIVVDKIVHAPFVAGAVEFIGKHSTDYACFIVSATPDSELKEIVMKRKMTGYFTGIYGAPARKDVIISSIINDYNLAKNEVLFIGDALNDYNAAESTGIHFIARVQSDFSTFDGIKCVKIKDLLGLHSFIREHFTPSR